MRVSINFRRPLALVVCGAALVSMSLVGGIAVSADSATPTAPTVPGAPAPGYAAPLLLFTAQFPVRDDIGPDVAATVPDSTAPDASTPADSAP